MKDLEFFEIFMNNILSEYTNALKGVNCDFFLSIYNPLLYLFWVGGITGLWRPIVLNKDKWFVAAKFPLK